MLSYKSLAKGVVFVDSTTQVSKTMFRALAILQLLGFARHFPNFREESQKNVGISVLDKLYDSKFIGK